MTDIRVGKSKDHHNRKNPSAREAWIKQKRRNRPKQEFIVDEYLNPTLPCGTHSPCIGHWEKIK